MKYAIIAAGEGARLVNAGVNTPKPLICLNGEPMIDRLIRIFADNNASSISIIINEEMLEVYDHLLQTAYPVRPHVLRKSTPSSMHSFWELSSLIESNHFCLTTVDTVFREDEFASFINDFEISISDGLFAVTNYVDDEKPLYVETGEDMLIKAFHDEKMADDCYVSGGIYGLSANSFPVLETCIKTGISKMRNFQRQLIKSNFVIKAYPFSKIIDVDHPSDIPQAELLVTTASLPLPPK